MVIGAEEKEKEGFLGFGDWVTILNRLVREGPTQMTFDLCSKGDKIISFADIQGNSIPARGKSKSTGPEG